MRWCIQTQVGKIIIEADRFKVNDGNLHLLKDATEEIAVFHDWMHIVPEDENVPRATKFKVQTREDVGA